MSSEQQLTDVISAVQSLNSECFVEGVGEEWEPFKLIIGGYFSYVEFMGIIIWDDDNDECPEGVSYEDHFANQGRKFLIQLNNKISKL